MSLFQFAACVEGYNAAHSDRLEHPSLEELHAALAWVDEQEDRDGEHR